MLQRSVKNIISEHCPASVYYSLAWLYIHSLKHTHICLKFVRHMYMDFKQPWLPHIFYARRAFRHVSVYLMHQSCYLYYLVKIAVVPSTSCAFVCMHTGALLRLNITTPLYGSVDYLSCMR